MKERIGKNGQKYGHRSAFCLETQHFPDCIHHPDWPSCVLRAGEVFDSKTIYSFYDGIRRKESINMADFTMDRFSLKGKTALVTGAERGIGLEIAKGLAAAGANIIIAGLMEEEFPKAKAAVRAKGVSCTVLKADISKEEDVLRLAEQAWEIFPERT